ncbi:MAG: hypothetical protein M3004_12315 [Bacteroidota bacterium]|nr:hypothetical protein [Bacteroidota bacterium]
MLLDFFSTLISGYLIVVSIWLITFIIVLVHLFRRTDITLPVQIFWAFIIFIAPVIGLIFYLIYGIPKRKKLLDVEKKIID